MLAGYGGLVSQILPGITDPASIAYRQLKSFFSRRLGFEATLYSLAMLRTLQLPLLPRAR